MDELEGFVPLDIYSVEDITDIGEGDNNLLKRNRFDPTMKCTYEYI